MRFIIAILVALGLIGAIFFFIVRGNSGQKAAPPPDLNKYAMTDAYVKETVDGRINSAQSHQAYSITVNRDTITFQAMTGYDGTVKTTKTYPNTQAAFTSFLKALSMTGYTNIDPKKPTDERGYCASSTREIFELAQGSQDISRGWITPCGQGNLKGSGAQARILFQEQVPDFNTLISQVRLYN